MSAGPAGPPDRLAETAAAVVRTRSLAEPRVGIVLGSGLGAALGDALRGRRHHPVRGPAGVPGDPVPGHAGGWSWGTLAGVPVAGFFGRFHLYEGHDPEVPALLPRLAHAAGRRHDRADGRGRRLVPDLAGGTAVILRDHLNVSGSVPLLRWRFADGMPAFVSGDVYDRRSGRSRSSGPPRSRSSRPRASTARCGVRPTRPPRRSRCSPARAPRWSACRWCRSPCRRMALGMRVLGICSLTNALRRTGDARGRAPRLARDGGRRSGGSSWTCCHASPGRRTPGWLTSRTWTWRPRVVNASSGPAARCGCSP